MKPRSGRREAKPLDEGARRAALVLWALLALLTLARAALFFVPDMRGWGLNLQRFLSPAWAWGPWALAALALVPPIARRIEPAFARAGEAIARGSVAANLSALAGAMLLVALLPDRVRFVGDFLLRQGTVAEALRPGTLFPQALPLDVLVHVRLPQVLSTAGLVGVEGTARLLGACEAGLLALLALAAARALQLRGTAALAAAAIVFFGGYLGLYTGYGKAFGEMVVLLAAALIFAVRAVRGERALLALGLVSAAAALLHRSALGMVPAVALAFVLALRARPAARREVATWAAVALPALALAFTLPRMMHTLLRVDVAVHLAPAEARAQGSVLASLFAGMHLMDVANVAIALSPLVLAIPFVAIPLGRRLLRDREAAILLALALPFVGLLAVVHPSQGVFRDWDTFAEAGVVLSLLTAWLVGSALRAARGLAWVGVAVTVGVAMPTVQWLVHQADAERGLTRVAAFLREPPARSAAERGKTWDYLGVSNYRLQRWDAAAEAFAHSAETQPSPRILAQWAMVEAERGDLRGAMAIYRRAMAAEPTSPFPRLGFAAVATQLGDYDAARAALEEVLRRYPENEKVRARLAEIERLQGRRDTPSSGDRAR